MGDPSAPGGAPPGRGFSNGPKRSGRRKECDPLYAALDLGTNNCRLLVAARTGDGFRVVDGYSRIVRLGEGMADTGTLSPQAMERAISALRVCADKMSRHDVSRRRCIATQACRGAENGGAFIKRVRQEVGLDLDVITPREEARLAVMGCMGLIDRACAAALVVDIGGGSTEISLVNVSELQRREQHGRAVRPPIEAWASIPIGVVTLAERFPEQPDPCSWYRAMLAHAREMVAPVAQECGLRDAFEKGATHIIGTSGTVTSLAGVHLGLPRYERARVDGLWVSRDDALTTTRRLQTMCHAERASVPCIGPERADLVMAGCAIFEAVAEAWPSERLRVADRGLREGMLMSLMHPGRRRRGKRGGCKRKKASGS